MKKKKKIQFKIYVLLIYVLCMILNEFLKGFYLGVIYGSQGMSLPKTNTQDEVAFYVIYVIIGILFYIMLNRKIAKPVEQLAKHMKRIAGGDLEARASTQLPREYQQMEDAFNQMADALQQAQEERLKQDANNQLLYSNIAHDLKTPMTMAMGYAKALERGDVTDVDKQKEYLHTIAEQTMHANELLDVLLSYTRLQNQAYQMKFAKGDLAEVLRSVVAQYYPMLEEHQSEVEIEIPEESVMCSFDAVEIRRVFSNLISNVIRHTPNGTACAVTMKVCDADRIEIVVADNGPKLDAHVKEKLFQPFGVGDESRNTKGGSGLGLSIVKKILERHDAVIQYTEDMPQGYKGFMISFSANK